MIYVPPPLTPEERKAFATTLRAAADAVERGDDAAMAEQMSQGANIVWGAVQRQLKEEGRVIGIIEPGEIDPIAKA